MWKKIKDFEEYEVSDKGEIRNSEGLILSQRLSRNGYLRVNLKSKGKYKTVEIHRVVAQAFLGAIYKKQVHHKNGDRTDNNVMNLQIVSKREHRLLHIEMEEVYMYYI